MVKIRGIDMYDVVRQNSSSSHAQYSNYSNIKIRSSMNEEEGID